MDLCMVEIKPNMYVRTENGWIGKVISERYEYKDDVVSDIEFEDDTYNTYELDYSIVKASYNIIDLIEVGDYVNGERVYHISNSEDYYKILLVETGMILPKQIETILTKETFEKMKYKVGE